MKYDIKNLSGDLFGGLTAGIVALPLALAFGITSGLPPDIAAAAGLYGAIAVGFFAALFGGTATQVSGPTGPMTVVAASIIATAHVNGAEVDLSFVFGTFALAGVFLVVMGVTRMGAFIKYMPYPVVSGFMTGIGAIIVLLQIFPALGHMSPSSPLKVITQLGDAFSAPHFSSLLLTMATVAVIYGWPHITKKVPGTLVALIGATAVVKLLDIDVALIGAIPSGLPSIVIPEFGLERLEAMVPAALSLAALGAIDSLLTSVVADNITRTRHKPNKELVGQGIGNIVAGLIGGLPGAGATMRTVVNVQSGGRSRLSGIVHSLLLLAILLGLGPLAALVPKPVLAGILITVGVGIVDYRGLKSLLRVPRSEASVLVTVLVLTVFFDLLWAVAAGLVLSSMAFIKKMTDFAEKHSEVRALTDDGAWADEASLSPELASKVFIKHLNGPIFFGFSNQVVDMLNQLPEVTVVIIRMSRVPYMDQSGMMALEETILRLQEQGVRVMIVGLSVPCRNLLEVARFVPNVVNESQLFDSFLEAVKQIAPPEEASAA